MINISSLHACNRIILILDSKGANHIQRPSEYKYQKDLCFVKPHFSRASKNLRPIIG